jgi:hypothetical protein
VGGLPRVHQMTVGVRDAEFFADSEAKGDAAGTPARMQLAQNRSAPVRSARGARSAPRVSARVASEVDRQTRRSQQPRVTRRSDLV